MQGDAAYAPAAVVLAFHLIERDNTATVRSDETHGLGVVALHEDRGLEGIGAGPVHRFESGAHHPHELFGCAKGLLDVRARKTERRHTVVAGQSLDLAFDHLAEGIARCVGQAGCHAADRDQKPEENISEYGHAMTI